MIQESLYKKRIDRISKVRPYICPERMLAARQQKRIFQEVKNSLCAGFDRFSHPFIVGQSLVGLPYVFHGDYQITVR